MVQWDRFFYSTSLHVWNGQSNRFELLNIIYGTYLIKHTILKFILNSLYFIHSTYINTEDVMS